ncbi:hypothetical protein LEMLEM_LOCUS4556 [Lemmus lemmus]
MSQDLSWCSPHSHFMLLVGSASLQKRIWSAWKQYEIMEAQILIQLSNLSQHKQGHPQEPIFLKLNDLQTEDTAMYYRARYTVWEL